MVNEIIQKRRSIRKFDPEGIVTDDQIRAMLHAAMLAPSACNCRPWEFIVIRDREKLDAIANFHPYGKMLKTAQAAIIINANPEALKGKPGEGMWQHDCGAATQNILLQAAAMDIGTCWCGLHPVKELMKETQKLLDIPEALTPFCVIAIGKSAEPFGARGFYEESKVKWM